MAKLYWRVKRDGKWTWRPVDVIDTEPGAVEHYQWYLVRLEEEE